MPPALDAFDRAILAILQKDNTTASAPSSPWTGSRSGWKCRWGEDERSVGAAISPLVGEMAGRPEGGAVPPADQPFATLTLANSRWS